MVLLAESEIENLDVPVQLPVVFIDWDNYIAWNPKTGANRYLLAYRGSVPWRLFTRLVFSNFECGLDNSDLTEVYHELGRSTVRGLDQVMPQLRGRLELDPRKPRLITNHGNRNEQRYFRRFDPVEAEIKACRGKVITNTRELLSKLNQAA